MSDGGRERASIGLKVWNSFQKWSVRRSAVRSIAWLDDLITLERVCDNFQAAQRYEVGDVGAIFVSAGE